MNLEEIYKAAITMEIGKERRFTLNQLPEKGKITALCRKLTENNEKGGNFSGWRSDLTLTIICRLI